MYPGWPLGNGWRWRERTDVAWLPPLQATTPAGALALTLPVARAWLLTLIFTLTLTLTLTLALTLLKVRYHSLYPWHELGCYAELENDYDRCVKGWVPLGCH